ncbi:plasmid recombination protein [Devosia sp.]|uniref:plasmid recombination protein n=1 Tax=Devosia sp. TaxID=1871048 RepID=UPI0025DDF9EE|nr:plasmid recombination protein [Devosia sp.]MCR6634906.1 plasmid recombination protein [Devosia sp.]
MHFDETTPHFDRLHVPIVNGRLNASFLGGKEKMRVLQDKAATAVARSSDIARGLKGSQASHVSMKKFYATERPKSLRQIRKSHSHACRAGQEFAMAHAAKEATAAARIGSIKCWLPQGWTVHRSLGAKR